MKFGQIKYRKRQKLFLASLCFVWLFLGTIPLKLAIAHYQAPSPQAILTLGGSSDREIFNQPISRYLGFLWQSPTSDKNDFSDSRY